MNELQELKTIKELLNQFFNSKSIKEFLKTQEKLKEHAEVK